MNQVFQRNKVHVNQSLILQVNKEASAGIVNNWFVIFALASRKPEDLILDWIFLVEETSRAGASLNWDSLHSPTLVFCDHLHFKCGVPGTFVNCTLKIKDLHYVITMDVVLLPILYAFLKLNICVDGRSPWYLVSLIVNMNPVPCDWLSTVDFANDREANFVL